MDDDRASDSGFTETDDNNSIMTPASDGTETTQTPNMMAAGNAMTAGNADLGIVARAMRVESQVHDLFTITDSLREQLTTQTQTNEQLKAELATTRAELASRLAAQESFAERLKLQRQAGEAQQNGAVSTVFLSLLVTRMNTSELFAAFAMMLSTTNCSNRAIRDRFHELYVQYHEDLCERPVGFDPNDHTTTAFEKLALALGPVAKLDMKFSTDFMVDNMKRFITEWDPSPSTSQVLELIGSLGKSFSEPDHEDSETTGKDLDEAADGESVMCVICGNHGTHWSIGPCNHPVCYICSLRRRALFKDKTCNVCKTDMPTVAFTDTLDRKFGAYTDTDSVHTNAELGICYMAQNVLEDAVSLLQYNCPTTNCGHTAEGWEQLHDHVRSTHKANLMCLVCTGRMKIFTHEHKTYTQQGLRKHQLFGDGIDFKAHLKCLVCPELTLFWDEDDLRAHCDVLHGGVETTVRPLADMNMRPENVKAARFLDKQDFSAYAASRSAFPLSSTLLVPKAAPDSGSRTYEVADLLLLRDVCTLKPTTDWDDKVRELNNQIKARPSSPIRGHNTMNVQTAFNKKKTGL
ncbi:hypothetical protein LTR97_007261 [Elasticomyces elasticus]|uniref:RING-type E3 ubiquitin transferase n=1 Tax=Elasticomyces elasticus TaxID=574655 RepID=A0AAN8A2H9_9PEZI|nr:hypothetical protein LTR97_007261 [Elasticomyces elasticus]